MIIISWSAEYHTKTSTSDHIWSQRIIIIFSLLKIIITCTRRGEITQVSLRKYTMCMFSVTRVLHTHTKKEKYSGTKVRNTGANTHGWLDDSSVSDFRMNPVDNELKPVDNDSTILAQVTSPLSWIELAQSTVLDALSTRSWLTCNQSIKCTSAQSTVLDALSTLQLMSNMWWSKCWAPNQSICIEYTSAHD